MGAGTQVPTKTLERILEACERLLADNDWFADRPYSWRVELERMREEIAEELEARRGSQAA
jgi:hypothetical protein